MTLIVSRQQINGNSLIKASVTYVALSVKFILLSHAVVAGGFVLSASQAGPDLSGGGNHESIRTA